MTTQQRPTGNPYTVTVRKNGQTKRAEVRAASRDDAVAFVREKLGAEGWEVVESDRAGPVSPPSVSPPQFSNGGGSGTDAVLAQLLAAQTRTNELLGELLNREAHKTGFRWGRVVALLLLIPVVLVAILFVLGGLADMGVVQ